MIKKINLLEMFCYIDDYAKDIDSELEKRLIGEDNLQRANLTTGEILTILIFFQLSGWKCFKYFYAHLLQNYRNAFPNLPSYSRFVEIKGQFNLHLILFITGHFGKHNGEAYIDSTPLKVCNNKRIRSNKVFKKLAEIGKSTMGWFYGFKLHLVINPIGEIISFKFSKGNKDDRQTVKNLCKNFDGKLYADKGYISKDLFEEMLESSVKIITQIKKNMKPKLMEFGENIMLKKRSVIESVFHILKDILNMEHTRHRNPKNYLVNLLGALAAYCLYPNKPSIVLPKNQAGLIE